MDYPEIVVFDMEGTLFKKIFEDEDGHRATSAWTLIAEHLGGEAQKREEESKQKWENGEYASYIEWVEEIVTVHQEHNLEKDYFDSLIQSVPYRNGITQLFTELHEHDVITAIITGGFKSQAKRIQKDHGVNHAYAACEYYWDENGKMNGYNLLPSDGTGKQEFTEKLLEIYDVSKDDVAFVGDGENDVHAAKFVDGPTISINGHSELQKIADSNLNAEDGQDLTTVLSQLQI